jgi:circadian clock protein KaiB
MSDSDIFQFRLYVADDTVNSSCAVANLRALCDRYLAGRHRIELVNVFKEPDRALEDRIFMTPTLVKLTPGNVARLVGTLSQTNVVLQVLGLDGAVE